MFRSIHKTLMAFFITLMLSFPMPLQAGNNDTLITTSNGKSFDPKLTYWLDTGYAVDNLAVHVLEADGDKVKVREPSNPDVTKFVNASDVHTKSQIQSIENQRLGMTVGAGIVAFGILRALFGGDSDDGYTGHCGEYERREAQRGNPEYRGC